MKQEDKVATYQQSKLIVELGVVLNTERAWILSDHNEWVLTTYTVNGIGSKDLIEKWLASGEYFPALDVAELVSLICQKFAVTFFRNAENIPTVKLKLGGKALGWFNGKTLGEALSAAFIWILENKYLNPENCKL